MNEDLKQADKNPKKKRSVSTIWLIPLAALLIGCWLIYHNIRSKGPVIELILKNAEGIESGKTKVKIRSVDVGTVIDLNLSEDYTDVVARIQMQPDIDDLLVEDTEFWVVKPRVGRQGVSGLGTIISGTYIQMRPGTSEKEARQFKVLDIPPATRPDVPGLTLSLTSEVTNTLSIGDPVIFQGQTVGQIETAEFNIDDLFVRYGIFIESPYNQLVTKNTKFWPRSGIDFQISSEGVDVQIGNLQAILAGGLTFGVPEGVEAGERVENGTQFKLYPSYKNVLEDRYDEKIEYVALFDDTVRYLYEGASVEYRGIRVGTVSQVPFFEKGLTVDQIQGLRIPVLLYLEPQRIRNIWKDLTAQEWKDLLSKQFENGLRATLKTANLLTGARFVDLVFNDDANFDEPEFFGSYPVFPSQPGGFTTLEQKVTRLLDKINNLPIESLMAEMESTLQSAGNALEDADSTLKKAEETMNSLNVILSDDSIRQLPGELKSTLEELKNTLHSYQQGRPVYENVNKTLQQLQRLMTDIGVITDNLRANPNALIFGNEKGKDPVPKAAE